MSVVPSVKYVAPLTFGQINPFYSRGTRCPGNLTCKLKLPANAMNPPVQTTLSLKSGPIRKMRCSTNNNNALTRLPYIQPRNTLPGKPNFVCTRGATASAVSLLTSYKTKKLPSARSRLVFIPFRPPT